MKTKSLMIIAATSLLALASCDRRTVMEKKVDNAITQQEQAQRAIDQAANQAAENVRKDVRRQIEQHRGE